MNMDLQNGNYFKKVEIEIDNLEEGKLTEISLPSDDKNKLLVFKYKNKEYCMGSLCPHYNLSLKDAVIESGKIICPFHMSTFDIETGFVVDGPSLNHIKSFPIKINPKNGTKYIELSYDSEDLPKSHSNDVFNELYNGCIPQFCIKNPNNSESITIIGGGISSLIFCETLRINGFTGSITIFEKSGFLPYDKTLLSKNLNFSVEKIFLRSSEHITQKLNIDFRLNHEITKIDFNNRKLIDSNENSFLFEKLLIATGVSAKRANVNKYKNLIFFNDINDHLRLRKYNEKGNKILIIGGGFNSVELSGILSNNGCEVTVVSKNQYPLEKSLGKEIGKVYLDIFNKKGINYISNCTFKEFINKSHDKEVVDYVLLSNNNKFYANCFIICIGTVPNTSFLSQKKKIVVDKYFRVKGTDGYFDNVFSVGDCISFPYLNGFVEIEHWNNSIQQARIAALNMLSVINKDKSRNLKITCDSYYKEYLPFFWVTAFGIPLRCIGFCELFDDIKIEGSLLEHKFIAFYFRNKKIVSIVTMGLTKVAAFLYNHIKNIKNTFELAISSYSSNEIIQLLKDSKLI